jgi:hypothetical protein
VSVAPSPIPTNPTCDVAVEDLIAHGDPSQGSQGRQSIPVSKTPHFLCEIMKNGVMNVMIVVTHSVDWYPKIDSVPCPKIRKFASCSLSPSPFIPVHDGIFLDDYIIITYTYLCFDVSTFSFAYAPIGRNCLPQACFGRPPKNVRKTTINQPKKKCDTYL